MSRNPLKNVYLKLFHFGIFNFIPDKAFLKIQYRAATGKKLNLKDPKSYNEKMQWIKLYDHNPLYTILADKLAVREYVKEKVGEEYLIPLLGHWNLVNDIEYDKLGNQFVLKTNHDSGGIVICSNITSFDKVAAEKKLNEHMKQNHFYMSREWAYKDVKPCIIAEKYMIDDEANDLRDYKFFCFNGEPKAVQVDFDRFINHRRNIYDMDWNLLDVTIKCPNDKNAKIDCPSNFDEMVQIARKLSAGLPEARIDLYSVNGKTYFGSITLYHGNGYEEFTPDSFGDVMGSWIDLSLCENEKTLVEDFL